MQKFYRKIVTMLIFLCAVCTYTNIGFAQEEPLILDIPEETIEEEVTEDIEKADERKIFSLTIENDLFGKGSDQNYTSGIRLGYLDVNAEFPDFAHRLARLIPTFEINETSSIFYSFGQNIYTPDNLRQRTQAPDDRPWAGYLYTSVGMVSLTDNHSDEIEASIGVVGPWALAEQTQKLFHNHLTVDSPSPKGWSNQLGNEPALMLAWQRRFPDVAKTDIGRLSLAASPYFGATIGNVYTYANTGMHFRLSPKYDKWQDTPVRVRPSMPGTGFFTAPEDRWSWYIFGGAEGRAMARNIFLDGSTFEDSHSVDKKNFVADLNLGFAVTYENIRLSYTLVHRTKEFDTQKDTDLFGAFGVSYSF